MAVRLALIGANIPRTRLPKDLQLMCDRDGIDLDFALIDAAEREGFEFSQCGAEQRVAGLTGVVVTHPFKETAAACAALAPTGGVDRTGASNYLKFGSEALACNTDFSGFGGAWRHRFGETQPSRVAMVGSRRRCPRNHIRAYRSRRH